MEEKVERIKRMIEKENEYLISHPKAKVETVIKKIKGSMKRLKIFDFCSLEVIGRNLVMKIDEEANFTLSKCSCSHKEKINYPS